MMAVSPIRPAQAAYSRDRWQLLAGAHALLVSGEIREGLSRFRAALRGLTDLMGGEPVSWPLLADDPRDPAASSALIALGDFYHLTKTWRVWPVLAAPVRESPDYGTLPTAVRGRIEAAWGTAHLSIRPPEQIAVELGQVLDDAAGDDSPDGRRARIALHTAIADASNYALDNAVGLLHAQTALDLNDPDDTPYYSIRAYESLGDSYYDIATFNNDDPDAYAACLAAYDAADAIVDRIGPDAWPMSRDYSKGWLFNRLEQFERAIEHFERGAFRRAGGGLLYDAGRCYYGMGYALLRLKRHDAARTSLYRALDMFSDDDHAQLNQDALGAGSRSPRMMAVTLQILGLAAMDEGDMAEALAHLELSREHLEVVTNPAAWYDTLQPLIEVCEALGDRERTELYRAELDSLRARFNLPD